MIPVVVKKYLEDHNFYIQYVDFLGDSAWLERFFFIKSKTAHKHTMEELLKKMQEFYNLEPTGTLDDKTVEIMKLPRCGMPDVSEYTTFEGSPKWKKNSLTYRIINTTSDLPQDKVESILAEAIKVWSDVTPLKFTKTTDTADIDIYFARDEHGDNYPFDGVGGTLAHAFAPGKGLAGDAHFDDDEYWTEDDEGTSLFIVAAHEFGHSLGLGHSKSHGALMYPTYSYKKQKNYKLPTDDVKGIQKLYGKKRS
uniref:Peptidase metallopeptidase domain-containing protein n=1 Tax=Anolis carolinensis TaxID=28377 RepID=A0A803TYD8_ANOCA